MCGRYAIFGPRSRYREHFDVDAWPDFEDHYNVAPSMWLPVIRQAPSGRGRSLRKPVRVRVTVAQNK